MNLHVTDSTGRAVDELRLSAWLSVPPMRATAQLDIVDGVGNLLGTITCPPSFLQVDLDALRSLVTSVREVRDAPGFCS